MISTEIKLKKRNTDIESVFTSGEKILELEKGWLPAKQSERVEAQIKTQPLLQKKRKKIQKGLEYSQQLSQMHLPQDYFAAMTSKENYFSYLFNTIEYERWPNTVKWTFESVSVLVGAWIVVILIPWSDVVRFLSPYQYGEVTLSYADVPSTKNADDESSEAATLQTAANQKEEAPVAPSEIIPNQESAKNVVAQVADKPKVEAKSKTESIQNDQDTQNTPKVEKAVMGELFRGTLYVKSLVQDELIKELIITLGGKKAGEVELGWKKNSRSSYYHFTINQTKASELETGLKNYGIYEVKKEKHPRLMPEGIQRFIITVEEREE